MRRATLSSLVVVALLCLSGIRGADAQDADLQAFVVKFDLAVQFDDLPFKQVFVGLFGLLPDAGDELAGAVAEHHGQEIAA